MYSRWRYGRDPSMSSPTRQVTHRRLPPLPGGKRGPSPRGVPSPPAARLYNGSPVKPEKVTYDMVVTGQTFSGRDNMTSSHVHQPYHLSPASPSIHDVHISSYDLNPDVVTTYLHDNHEFLEKYILSHHSQEQIEKWLVKKTHQQKNRLKNNSPGSSPTGENIPRTTRDSISKWKFSMGGEKGQQIQDMTKDIHKNNTRAQVLRELAACIAAAINADGFNLYMADEVTQVLKYYDTSKASCDDSKCWKIAEGTNVAAYVARTREALRLKKLQKDSRFPEGLGVTGEDEVTTLLSQPVVADGDVVGVVEVYRHEGSEPFNDEDEEVAHNILVTSDWILKSHEMASSFVVWGSVAVHYAEMYHSMTKQRKLNEFLLTVTKSIFQDIVSMDTVIMKIMNYAKKLVNADRTALFLVESKTRELYARVFDMGEENDDKDSSSQTNIQKEIRFSMDKGVAGYVASTGNILNIPDAYADNRFNRDVDKQTGYHTKTLLCMPIYIRGNIIGVVQMVNKLNGVFTKADEDSFETFAIYCGLALHHAKLYEKIRRSEQKYKVALEVLSYHSMATEEEVDELKKIPLPQEVTELTTYEYSPWSVNHDEKPVYVIHMFQELFASSRFDIGHLYKFTLTVRKNYRHVPYHNWDHAFSVAHAMFTVLKTTANVFTPLEALGLYVACLCHDVDHRGYTNQFMVKSASPLAAIYSTSTMEHHHFNHTITILQQEGHNIFRHLSSDEYKTMLSDIRHCILATDLALFFGNRARLKDIVESGNFKWDNKDHRKLAKAIMMTSCDLCASAKPWDIQLDTVKVIFEEFYVQGDQEKEKGQTPIPMMDRDKANELPKLEVGFLVGICLPCYELMSQVLPETVPMVEGAKANLKKWQELADEQEAIQGKKENHKTEAKEQK